VSVATIFAAVVPAIVPTIIVTVVTFVLVVPATSVAVAALPAIDIEELVPPDTVVPPQGAVSVPLAE
jgi:hypothetical protein